MRKEVIIDKMNDMGLDPSINGFWQLAELLERSPASGDLCATYEAVGAAHGYSGPSIERNIRHLIERFYCENANVPMILRVNASTGKLPNRQFIGKLRIYMHHDTARLADGTELVITKHPENAQMYAVRKYTDNSNYVVQEGSYEDCVKFIENGGHANVI